MKLKKGILLLLPLPCLAFWTGYLGTCGRLFYRGANLDPEYAYLFNSLNIIRGIAPFHVDHPGTPLQLLGAAVIYLRNALSFHPGSTERIVLSVLRQPESYLHAVHLVLLTIVCLATVVTARRLLAVTGSLAAAVLFEIGIFCHLQLQSSLTRVSPEPLLVAASFALMCVLTSTVFERNEGEEREGTRHSASTPLAAGAIVGVGIAVKVTFAPLALLILMYDGRRRRVNALLGMLLSFLVATLPISSKYGQVCGWLASLALHQERYGHGAVGLPSAAALSANAAGLLREAPILFAALALFLLLVLAIRPSHPLAQEHPKVLRFLRLSVLAILLQVVVTIKHPSPHYLVPSMALAAYVSAVAVYWLGRFAGTRKLFYLFSVAVLLAAACTGYRTVTSYRSENAYDEKVKRMLATVDSRPDALKVGYFRSSLPGFALAFGNQWSGSRYGAELNTLYRDAMFYDVWRKVFYRIDGTVIPRERVRAFLSQGKDILLEGSKGAVSEGDLVCEEVCDAGPEAVYRLRAIGRETR